MSHLEELLAAKAVASAAAINDDAVEDIENDHPAVIIFAQLRPVPVIYQHNGNKFKPAEDGRYYPATQEQLLLCEHLQSKGYLEEVSS